MPRLLINGFPEASKACFHIRVNAAAKGSGAQSKILFDKTISPKEGIYELPLERIYLGATVRLEITIPGFLIIDSNVTIRTHKGFTTLNLIKQSTPDTELIVDSFHSMKDWQQIDCKVIYNASKKQFQQMIQAERRQERNTFLAAMALVLLFAGIIYMFVGPVGVFVIIIFAFYYQEKNKLNTWSDISK